MILIDSDVLIAHLRGAAVAQDWLLSARQGTGPLATSVIAIAEVTGGMRSAERHNVIRLLDSLHIFPVDEIVARRAGELRRAYRRSHTGISLGDYLIAATADTHGLELATLNTKHFPMFPAMRPPFAVP